MRCCCLHTPQSSYSQKMLNYECNKVAVDSLLIHTWLFRHVNYPIHQTLQHFTYTFVYSMPVVKTCLPSDKCKSFEGLQNAGKEKVKPRENPICFCTLLPKLNRLPKWKASEFVNEQSLTMVTWKLYYLREQCAGTFLLVSCFPSLTRKGPSLTQYWAVIFDLKDAISKN